MHEAAPFYVTLPCDSCLDAYPKNNASEWITRLQQPIAFKGRWEVCLAEVQYTNSLWTLQEDQTLIVSQIISLDQGRQDWFVENHTITVKAGVYREPALDIIKHINSNMPKPKAFHVKINDPENEKPGVTVASPALHIEPSTSVAVFKIVDDRVEVALSGAQVYITFPRGSETLMAMFGLEARQNSIKFAGLERNVFKDWEILTVSEKYAGLRSALLYSAWSWRAPRLYDPTAGKQILYVYSSVADYSFIGNEKAQLLRTLAVEGRYGELKMQRFDIGHYVPVLPSQFETIQVTIASETGENAHFHSGKSLVKLHFRPYRAY